MEKNLDKIIKQTQCWLDSVIIEHNICPFAKRERDKGSIHFYVDNNQEISQVLEDLVIECERLDEQPEIETTLFVLAQFGQDFNDYLDFLDIANQLLIAQGYEGVYQLASFHPEYCFSQTDENDPANYTNRSPYPMLHIIREKSLEKALENYPDPELIPERNVDYCQNLGLEKLQAMLQKCLNNHQ
ncbi:MAG: DUF1415 domain-containing protein [gamma proteobacterium symbiont of Bathyaustriella thionipta]|nr:DUF1415 domain-containing protein [gamma proteobacterium symbiont of Bathyaustriella thionipta]MCU7951259.1 DUF1415 domain-containing protein [gamma proteobacterium symbiont of Bathyaustriella thionipta]MCU7952402.1 DUF1415 domain-containing protein [gamma proteobacterium symbiont of Bathyaustriella thionipta]MCU7957794.1 DUF1415 domain-containing protein [gamma proteobacterium symbiont of Bathyaustriella thionipta]